MAQQNSEGASMAEYKDSLFKMASTALSASKVGFTRAKQVCLARVV